MPPPGSWPHVAAASTSHLQKWLDWGPAALVGLLLHTDCFGEAEGRAKPLAFHHASPPDSSFAARPDGVLDNAREALIDAWQGGGTLSIGRGEAILFAYEPTSASQPGCPGRSPPHAEQRAPSSEATQRAPIGALIYGDDSHWCVPPGGLTAIRTAGNDSSRVLLPIGRRPLRSTRRMLPYGHTLLYG